MSKVFGEEYVLGKFTGEEMEILEKVIPKIVKRLIGHVIGGLTGPFQSVIIGLV